MEEFVLESLFNGERETRIHAANELGKLCSKQKHKLTERGILSPLVSMLYSQDYGAIEAALHAILSLAFGSERNKIRIVNSGVIPVLLELLQCQSLGLIDLTMAALLILSSCAANKLAIASSGAIQLLVEILNQDRNINSTTTQTKLDAVATLHNLSTCHQITPLIIDSGIVFTLLQLIHNSEKSSELVEKAMVLLQNIVSFSEGALQETAGACGAIRALVETIEDGSPQGKEHAVEILVMICQSCREKYRGLILREGIMPGLLQLSVDGTWRARDTAQELLMLLRDYKGYGSRSKQTKSEIMEQIMQEIDAEGEGTTLTLLEEMMARLST